MPSNRQLLRLIKNFLPAKLPQHHHRRPLARPLCSTAASPSAPAGVPSSPESLDIPSSSFTNNLNPVAACPDDDDAAIRALSNWVGKNSFKTDQRVPGPLSDIDRVSEILKQQFSSVNDVVQALNGCGVRATDALVSQALERYRNHWVLAFGVFTWAKHRRGYVHTAYLYNGMLDILGKYEKFGLMWGLLDEMKGLKGYISLVTMAKVMRRLASAGKYDDAIQAFREIEKFGMSKNATTLNVIMDAFAKKGSTYRAHGLFAEFKDCIPLNCYNFNVLIHGYCREKRPDDARKVLLEMQKQGLCPDVVSYTCLIEAYAKRKDFQNAFATLNEMREKGCRPDVVTHTVMMHALGKAGRTYEALQVYEKMKTDSCVPDTPSFISFIYILSKSGRFEDAWNVFVDMKKQGVPCDVATYNALISSACATSQHERAVMLLQRMEEDSCKPNVLTYAPFLKLCCRKKNIELIQFLLSHMVEKNVSIDPGTYALLVSGLCRSGKLEHACAFFEEMVLKGMVPLDSIYNVLLKELEQKDMVAGKEKIEKLMLQAKSKKQHSSQFSHAVREGSID